MQNAKTFGLLLINNTKHEQQSFLKYSEDEALVLKRVINYDIFIVQHGPLFPREYICVNKHLESPSGGFHHRWAWERRNSKVWKQEFCQNSDNVSYSQVPLFESSSGRFQEEQKKVIQFCWAMDGVMVYYIIKVEGLNILISFWLSKTETSLIHYWVS